MTDLKNLISGQISDRALPLPGQAGEKIRPAVVVQNDAENGRLANTVLATITGNLDDAG